MAKFKTSKVAPGRKGANYSTGKKFSFRSQDEQIERTKGLLQKSMEQHNHMCYFCEERGKSGAVLDPEVDKRVHKGAGKVWACDDCMSAPNEDRNQI